MAATGAGSGPERRMLAGRYELGDRLGRGGMGTVWRAQDLMLDREVAVKELTVNHLPEEDLAILQSRMKQEARAAARIKHAGVITIHDVLEQDGRPWIVMELIDGRSLADVVSQDGPLSPRAAAEVGSQVLAALHRGHQLGVLHRDVKPANVLLEHGTGRAVLLDFGIAKFEGSSELTRPGDLVGSPDYLAPERARGERFGPASDLWGLGATLYAAVEGRSPFRRDTPLSTLAAVVDEPLPAPIKAGALAPVLAALMAKESADRPTADEAQLMLRAVIDGQTIGIGIPLQPLRMPTQAVPVVDRRPVSESDEPLPEAPATPTGTGPTTPVAATPGAPLPPGPLAPPTAVPPAPVPPRRRRRRALRLALAALAVALLAGGTAVAVQMYGPHHGTPVAGPTPSAPPSTSATSSGTLGTPSVSPSTPGTEAAPSQAPSGYSWQTDELGMRFPLPVDGQTWRRTTNDTGNGYYSPDGQRHLIQLAKNVGQAQSPIDHLSEISKELSTNPTIKDYKVESLESATMNGHEAARWVFTFTNLRDPNKGPRKAFEEEFKNSDGTAYAILVSGPSTSSDETTLTERRFMTELNYLSVVAPR
ncbi:serine/threonine-protein kinase [Kitasatospora acidiphila]|nr:serine/threonine-protein kinase [Kitasatospora acidiphila]